MIITDIKKQVKTEGRYSIYVDGKFAFGLSELGLINSGIKVGQELTKDRLDELKKNAQEDKLYNMVLSLIARRPRSIWEVRDYLKRKGLPIEGIEAIIHGLTYKGFLNDLEFASTWVENRRLFKPISMRKLALELRQKHVSDEIIQTVLAEDETNELDVLRELIAKKRTQSKYQDDQKLMQYLARQGFSYGDIKEAMQKSE